MKVEELLALVSALPTYDNVTRLQTTAREHISLPLMKVNQLVSILMKTTGWSVSCQILPADDGTVKAILRLNRAGRRYLDQRRIFYLKRCRCIECC
jgi:hypothetical protein